MGAMKKIFADPHFLEIIQEKRPAVAVASGAGKSANAAAQAELTKRLTAVIGPYKEAVSQNGPEVAQMKSLMATVKQRIAAKDFEQAAKSLDELEPLVAESKVQPAGMDLASAPDDAPADEVLQSRSLSAGPAPGGGSSGPATAEPDEALDATSTDIFFDKKSAKLTDRDKESLDAYASAYLAGKSSVPVNVDGFASIEGDPTFNQTLSKQRAEAVADYLRKKGLPKVTAKPQGPKGSMNELRQNRRATITPPPLTVRDIVGKVVVEPPISDKKPNPTLGEKADEPDISNIHIPDPPPEDDGPAPKYPHLDDDPKPAETTEPGKTKPPQKEDEGPEHSGEYDPKKGTVKSQVTYTVKFFEQVGAGPITLLEDGEIAIGVNDDPKKHALAIEAKINVIKGSVQEKLKGVGDIKITATLSVKTESNMTDDASKKTESGFQADVEVELVKLGITVKLSADRESPITFALKRPPEDKKKIRDHEKAAVKDRSSASDKALEQERKEIKEKYEAARDQILPKLPEKVRKMAKKEMDEAIKVVKKPEPFVASDELKAAGVSSDVEAEMKKAVEDYQKEMFHSMGGDD